MGVLAVERAAGDGGVDAEDGVERRDSPVGAEGEARVGVEERAEGVGGLDPYRPDAALDPAAVIDGVVRLHRGDDPDPAEARDVLEAQVLTVLVAEAAVAGAVDAGDAVVDVEQDGVGAIADGVHGDLQPRRVRGADPPAHAVLGILGEAAVTRRIGVRLEEERGARAG